MLDWEHRWRQGSPAVPISQGVRGGFLDPHPTEALTPLSHNPVHLRNQLSQAVKLGQHINANPVPPDDLGSGPLLSKGIGGRLRQETSRALNDCSH